MWRKKRFIIGLLAAVVIAGVSLGSVAVAHQGEDNSQSDTLMARVADILGIDQQSIEDAFVQARSELKEERLDSYLQSLIDEGTITEDQAAEYREWLDSKPAIDGYKEQMQDWIESRPDLPEGLFPRLEGKTHARGGIRGEDEPDFAIQEQTIR